MTHTIKFCVCLRIGMGSLPEVLMRLDAAPGNPHGDAALALPDAMAPVVVAFFAVQFRRTSSGSSAETACRRQHGNQRLQHARVMDVDRRNLRRLS